MVANVVSSVSLDGQRSIVKLWPNEDRGECSRHVFQDMKIHAQKVCKELSIDFTKCASNEDALESKLLTEH